jgi:hypothetical protein
MLPPDQDEDDRRPVWDTLQMFWMDTEPSDCLRSSAEVCARSKYSLSEIEAIFWNEVRPAVGFNMYSGAAPEWAGFEIGWLSKRILQKNRFGRRLPAKFLNPYANGWWKKLRVEIERVRRERTAGRT